MNKKPDLSRLCGEGPDHSEDHIQAATGGPFAQPRSHASNQAFERPLPLPPPTPDTPTPLHTYAHRPPPVSHQILRENHRPIEPTPIN